MKYDSNLPFSAVFDEKKCSVAHDLILHVDDDAESEKLCTRTHSETSSDPDGTQKIPRRGGCLGQRFQDLQKIADEFGNPGLAPTKIELALAKLEEEKEKKRKLRFQFITERMKSSKKV